MDFAEFARALARWRQGRRFCLVAVHSTRSTHLLARRIVEEYGRESLVPPEMEVVAWGQTGGVGREGRRWASPAGKGIYATLIRHLASDRIRRLPLAISATACETLDRLLGGGGRCRLKWPNDLLVGGRKLGGILIDVVSPPAGAAGAAKQGPGALAIISLGVNFSRDLEAFEAPRATSLEAEQPATRVPAAGVPAAGVPAPSLDRTLRELVEAVDAELASEASSPRGAGAPDEALLDRYRGLSCHRPGDEIRCRVHGALVTGSFLGFDRHGFLRLDVDGVERTVTSGVIGDGSGPRAVR